MSANKKNSFGKNIDSKAKLLYNYVLCEIKTIYTLEKFIK